MSMTCTWLGCKVSRPEGEIKIEHRLFSFITMNWRGKPLLTYRTVVELIAATTTKTGLRVEADFDQGSYPTGVTVTDAELAAIPIRRHDWHPDWNYSIHPHPPPEPPE